MSEDARADRGVPPTGRAWPPFTGRQAVLATKHGKLPLIAPPLAAAVGLAVTAVGVDTDTLGTFTGEVPRPGPPLATAVAKARLAMESAGVPLGLASEGSIGPHPDVPFCLTDAELVVLVDDRTGLVVAGRHVGLEIRAASAALRPGDDAQAFLASADFPAHRLIVRPNEGPPQPVHKGIATLEALAAAVAECAAVSPDGLALAQTDLRAHACPSRRPAIAAAAADLARRLAARCPACGAPGWGPVDVETGIPCEWCGTDVPAVRAEIDGCALCDHRRSRPVIAAGTRADPGECAYCNP